MLTDIIVKLGFIGVRSAANRQLKKFLQLSARRETKVLNFSWFAAPRPRRCQTTNKMERKWDIFKRKIMMRDRTERKKEKNFTKKWKIRRFRWGSGLYRLGSKRPYFRRCGHLPPRKRPTNQRENIKLSRVFQIMIKESESRESSKFLDLIFYWTYMNE